MSSLKKIIISGTVKTGSTFLLETIKKYYGGECERIHITPAMKEYHVLKNTIILIPIRNQKNVNVSSYFEGIFSGKINSSECNVDNIDNINDINDINNIYYTHFHTIDFNSEELCESNNCTILSALNYESETVQLEKTDMFYTIPFKIGGYVIKKLSYCTVCFIDFKILDNRLMLNNMFKDLEININLKKITKQNVSNEKTYAEHHKLLIDKLHKDCYFDNDYYDFIKDDMIYTIVCD